MHVTRSEAKSRICEGEEVSSRWAVAPFRLSMIDGYWGDVRVCEKAKTFLIDGR